MLIRYSEYQYYGTVNCQLSTICSTNDKHVILSYDATFASRLADDVDNKGQQQQLIKDLLLAVRYILLLVLLRFLCYSSHVPDASASCHERDLDIDYIATTYNMEG